MDDITVILIWRAIERIIIVLLGGGSLWMGWNLFCRGIIPLQSAEFKSTSFGFKMTKVGPGIFFALFGTFILYHSLANRVDVKLIQNLQSIKNNKASVKNVISKLDPKPNIPHSIVSIGMYGGSLTNKNKNLISAINSLNKISVKYKLGNAPKQIMTEFNKAIFILNNFHYYKMQVLFTRKKLTWYANVTNKDKLSELKRKDYDLIARWMNERLK